LNEQILESTGLAVQQDPTPLSLIAQMVASGTMSAESVAVVKELVSLKEHMEDRQAEKDFAVDFGLLQGELGSFRPTKAVPDKYGNVKYTYLPYSEIMAAVQPLLRKFGFSVSFSTEFKDGRILQTCTLQHASGYHRDFRAYVRVGNGPPGATESQADGAAMTYAKRYALCNALNITVEHDTDARKEGEPISAEQAATLKKMVKESRADEVAFLKFAGAKTYEELGSRRYAEVFAALEKKMGGTKP
jgi:hypothetical protein